MISSNKPCRFTLSSFNAMFSKLKYKYDYTETVNGEWNSDINGGNWAMSTYINNPQYDIIAKQTTELIMVCMAKAKSISIYSIVVVIVWENEYKILTRQN